MKQISIIAISVIFFVFSGKSQDTIPNNSFENWISDVMPKNWETTNMLLPFGVNNCFRTSNSFEGTYALQLKSIDLEGMIVPGVATIGHVGINYTSGGVAFTERPVSLKGFFRHPSSGDEILIAIELFKQGVHIGSGSFTTSDSIPDYSEFIIPVDYISNEYPDTMNITILTDPYVQGSSLYIDNLDLEFQTTGTADKEKFDSKILCYPNPSIGNITFELPGQGKSEIQIYSLSGSMLKEISTIADFVNIDLTSFEPGMYVARIQQGSHLTEKKIILK